MTKEGNGGAPVPPVPSSTTLSDFNSTMKLTEKNTETDEYNPFDHRNKENANSTMGSLAHLLKSSLGTGILAMPAAFKNSGLLVGAIGTLVLGLICTYCVHILVKTSHQICKKTKVPVLGFSETVERVVEYGPYSLRKYSSFFRSLLDFAMMLTYYSSCAVYTLFIGNSLQLATNELLGANYNVRVYILLAVPVILLIAQVRTLRFLVPFSAVANVFIVIVFGTVLYYIFNDELTFSDKPLFNSWSTLPLYFSTVLFAMEGIGAVMPVENEMQNPKRFLGCPGVLNTAMLTVVALYGSLGFFGYVRFGADIKGSITLNLPPGDIASIMSQYLIAIAILFTYGLNFYIPMDILWKNIHNKISKEKHNFAQISIRTVIVLILALLAIAVPDLEPFIALVGAVFFSTLGLLVPAFTETVFLWPNTGRFHWILIKNIILGTLAICAAIAGATVSIIEIVKIYTGEHDETQ